MYVCVTTSIVYFSEKHKMLPRLKLVLLRKVGNSILFVDTIGLCKPEEAIKRSYRVENLCTYDFKVGKFPSDYPRLHPAFLLWSINC